LPDAQRFYPRTWIDEYRSIDQDLDGSLIKRVSIRSCIRIKNGAEDNRMPIIPVRPDENWQYRTTRRTDQPAFATARRGENGGFKAKVRDPRILLR
jgi:hypothetical protein